MIKKGIFNNLLSGIKKHSPELLVGVGITGMIGSTVLAVKATPKALQLLEDKKEEVHDTHLTPKEIIQAGWKPYAPAFIMGVVSAACIIGGTSVNLKRNTALATVYAISENTLKRYKHEIVKEFGEDKAREIDKSVAKARLKERPVIVDGETTGFIHETGNGSTLMFDTLSGRYFKSSTNAVERAVNNLNKSLLNDQYVTVNELYNEIGIPTIGAGSLIGWCADKEMADIFFTSDVNEDGTPYVVLEYRNRPEPLYNSHYYL